MYSYLEYLRVFTAMHYHRDADCRMLIVAPSEFTSYISTSVVLPGSGKIFQFYACI